MNHDFSTIGNSRESLEFLKKYIVKRDIFLTTN
jgi:hypothetical protein